MKKIKILVIVDNLNKCDGIASYVMNYYKNIDNSNFQFDFLVSKYTKNNVHPEYLKLIQQKNDRIIYRNNLKTNQMLKEIISIKDFFSKNRYDIIHCHILNMGFFYLWCAKKAGVKIRILHSHTTYLWSKNIVTGIRNSFFKYLTIRVANVYFACSNMAGKYMFKNKKYELVKNAINIKDYTFNKEIRNSYRQKLNINNELVIGHIGRFNIQKNHEFLLEIIENLSKEKNDIILMLVGKGELEEKIKKDVLERNLVKRIIFLGERDDVNCLLQAIDIFVLPSLFEGLPVIGVEAQAADLPCIFSSEITKEIKLISSSVFLPITDCNLWVDKIKEFEKCKFQRTNVIDIMKIEGYEIETATKKLERLYIQLIDEKY